MDTPPNNNFVGIALAVIKDAVRVDSTMEDTMRPTGRNILYLVPTYIKDDSSPAQYLNRRKLPDGRVLEVEFFDSYHHIFKTSYNSLEIKLEPSKTNPVGFTTEETCNTPTQKLGAFGGIFSWSAPIGRVPVISEPVLKVFYQLNGPERWAYYNLEHKVKGTVDKAEMRKGKRDDKLDHMSPSDVDAINSKYQRLKLEVLAVLQGEADTITVS